MSRSTVTLKRIAEEVGCSPMVVSVVLRPNSNNVRVSESTRERVLATATALGYRPNELARAVVTGKNQVFGFLTPHAGRNAEFKGRVLAGAFGEANRHAHLLKVHYIQDDLSEAIERSLEYRLAGLITLSLSAEVNEQLRKELSPHDMPVAVIGDVPEEEDGVQVVTDDESGLRAVLEHLLELGHTRIAFLSGQAGTSVADWRRQTFARLMEEAGLKLPTAWNAAGHWWDIESNEAVAHELLSQKERPSAIVAAGDMAAVVAQRMARRMGLRVPDDLSVTGYGDYTLAQFADPPLTTVNQNFEEMGAAAVRHLLGGNDSPFCVLPTELVVRESTGAAPF